MYEEGMTKEKVKLSWLKDMALKGLKDRKGDCIDSTKTVR